MSLRVRDTLTGEVRPVAPRRGHPVSLYVCGPTVYDVAHVGHARTYLYFDLVRRWFRDQGVAVRHVMNITDFEDKLTARALALGVTWRALARREERGFLRDLGALGILPPHETPRASDFVPNMIELIRRLERAGRIERREDGWYFRGDPAADGRNFPVGRALESHAVFEPGVPPPGAEGSSDFLVWKPQASPAPSWPSPWGPGMPGWHLECFTMAERYLTVPVDLHGGGVDLIYPHHFAENEIALALRGAPFSRAFLHTGFVTENGRKMSKSVGNLIPLRLALHDVGPDALRWYLLSNPYSQRLEWRTDDLERARSEFNEVHRRFRRALAAGAGGRASLPELRRTVARVLGHLGRGFHVDEAVDVVRQFSVQLDRAPLATFPKGDRPSASRLVRRLESLLGMRLGPN